MNFGAFYVENIGDKIKIDVVIPGVKKKTVNISVIKNVLSITFDFEDKPYRLIKDIPDYCDADNASATLEDGILSILFNMKNEYRSKQITIS